jgi:hypothetical protein
VCGFGNISVNGHHLSVEGSSPTSGQATLVVQSASDGVEHSLMASWNFDCLYDIYNYSRQSGNEERPIAQALRFQFLTVNGTLNIHGNYGFTFSFIQSPDPEFIRVDARLWPSGDFMVNEWSDLDHLRLPTTPTRPQGLGDEEALVPASRPCPKKQGPIFKLSQSFREWRSGGSRDGSGQDPSPQHLSPHHRFHHRLRVVSIHVAIILAAISIFTLFIFSIRTVVHKCWASRRHSRAQRRQRRAKRRAERWSRCLARHSARRDAWRSWWRKHFRRGGSVDGEKHDLAHPQEVTLQNSMQSEIRDLREAANMVSNIIAAEEGRARPPPPIRTLSLGSEASLPSYRSRASEAGDESPPPGYDENGADDVVVDGFQYTPSATTWTPDSSVVGSPKSSVSEHDDYMTAP